VRIGSNQARILRHVADNPGCAICLDGDPSGFRSIDALERRGLLDVQYGRDLSNTYAVCDITDAGRAALALREKGPE
jgi:hypothetical protein